MTVALAKTDLEELRGALRELHETGRFDDALEVVLALVGQLQLDNARLAAKLTALMRGRAGGASEKFSSAQLALFMNLVGDTLETEDDPASTDADAPAPTDAALEEESQEEATGSEKKKPRRQPLPADLPRERVEHLPPEEERVCAVCGRSKTCIGYACSEMLDYQPVSFRVLVHARAKLACKEKDCEASDLVIAPVPPKPIERGIPTSALLADVVVRKGVEHTPIHRLQQIYSRLGADLPDSTLYGWWSSAGDLLKPLAERIGEQALQAHLLQVDDSGIPVLDEDAEKGRRRGRLWLLLGDSLWARYRYAPNWKHEHVHSFLEDRAGWVQGDGYGGYVRLETDGQAKLVGCWAHARRYFVKALDGGDHRAAKGLALIGQLFKIERRADSKDYTPGRRKQLRAEKSYPVLLELGLWVAAVHPNAPPDTTLGKAITYLVSQWERLKRFLEDGRVPLTNNDCERGLRHFCLGRKNWLHTRGAPAKSGPDRVADIAAHRIATLYTVLATALAFGLNPSEYLTDVFDKLATGWPINRLDELLPPNWKEQRLQQAQTDRVS